MNRRHFLLASTAAAGCTRPSPAPVPKPAPIVDQLQPKATVFTDPVPARAPSFTTLILPPVPNAAAIWGGTGRDRAGNMFLGVCTEGDGEQSAALLAFDPATNTVTDRGNVVQNLKRLGLARPGDRQQKIHTKIWEAPAGRLWFASMDEFGENEDGSKLPTFGSHIWSVSTADWTWTHHAAVPEAIIAAAAPDDAGTVAFLGYFGHVLFRVSAGGDLRRIPVGSYGGHVSRNIVADRGRVFVPRVTADSASLIEFDESLLEVGATPLRDYSTKPDGSSHGLSGVAALKPGAAVITDRGRVYVRTTAGFADGGFLHPDGPCYVPCLFSPDGATQLVGLGYRDVMKRQYEWIVYDVTSKKSRAFGVAPPVPVAVFEDLLLYGSITRDDAGRFYVGGRYVVGVRSLPVAFAIDG